MSADRGSARSDTDAARVAPPRAPSRREGLVTAALFAALAFVYYADVLVGSRVLVTSDFRWYFPWIAHSQVAADVGFRYDSAQTYFPRRLLSRRALQDGEAPLWNPHAALGMPLLADYQTAPFYPINLLLLPMDPLEAMGAFVFLHAALAGLFMYLCARDLGLGRVPAAFAGLAFQWNGYFVTYEGHPTHIATGTWLPLLLLLVRRALLAPRGFPLALTLALAALLLAGFPQTLAVSATALAAYGVFLFALRTSGPLAARLARAAALAAAAALAFALAAPEVLPMLELSRLSHHQAFTHESIWEINQVPFVTYLKALFPDFFGNPIDGTSWLAWPHRGLPHPNDLGAVAYAGVLTPLLAIAGLAALRPVRRGAGEPGSSGPRAAPRGFALGETIFFAGMVAVPVLFMSVAAANRLLWHLPGWGFSSEIHRVEFLAFVGSALLAARGLDTALAPDAAGRRVRRALAALAALLAAFLAAFLFLAPRVFASIAHEMLAVLQSAQSGAATLWLSPKMFGWIARDVPAWTAHVRGGVIEGVALAAAGVTLLLARARAGRRAATLLAALLLLLHAADVTRAARRFHTPQPRAGCYAETEGIAALRALSEERPGRLFRFGRGQVLPPNVPSVLGLDDAGGYNALLVAEYGEAFDAVERGAFSRGREVIGFEEAASLDSPLYRLAGARYLVVGPWREAGPLLPEWPFRDLARLRVSQDLTAPGRFGLAVDGAADGARGARPALAWSAPGEAALPLPRDAGDGDSLAFRWQVAGAQPVHLDVGVLSGEILRLIWTGPLDGGASGWIRAAIGGGAAPGGAPRDEWLVVRARAVGDSAAWPGLALSRFRLAVRGAQPADDPLAADAQAEAEAEPAAGPGGYRLRFAGDLIVFETDAALPRARLVHRARVEPNRRAALRRIAGGEIDVEREAIVERAPAVTLDATGGASDSGEARIVASRATRVEIETMSRAPALLVLADTYYPGWEATADGAPAEILRANGIFRAVALPPGRHRVVFRFVSPPFRTGCRLAAAALAAIPIGVALGRRRRRAPSAPRSG